MEPSEALSYPIIRPIDTNGVEILADKAFQQSCHMIQGLTLLDTPRLANLWTLCRLTDPSGAMMEVGTYRGGGALHLSNCCLDREIVICDPFDNQCFQHLDPELDRIFRPGHFQTPGINFIAEIFKHRKAHIVPGYFPESVRINKLSKVSFVHLDVDVYQATRDSLLYMLSQGFLCNNSLIVLDDYNRLATGVNQAVSEVLQIVKGTMAFPLFPGQALIVPPTWNR